jgi:hypothetical protein
MLATRGSATCDTHSRQVRQFSVFCRPNEILRATVLGFVLQLTILKRLCLSLLLRGSGKSAIAQRQRRQDQEVQRGRGHQPSENNNCHGTFDLAARIGFLRQSISRAYDGGGVRPGGSGKRDAVHVLEGHRDKRLVMGTGRSRGDGCDVRRRVRWSSSPNTIGMRCTFLPPLSPTRA